MPEINLEDLYAKDPGTVGASTPAAVGPSDYQINMSDLATGEAATAGTPAPVQAGTFASQDISATQGQAATAAAGNAAAVGYDAVLGQITPEMTAAGQLATITGQSSPLMARARQEGLQVAGRRGLTNSSIAAGTAMGAMVDRAAPIALQDASTYFQQGLQNQAAQNRAREFTAGAQNVASLTNAELLTQANIANANMQSDMAALNAQLQTAVAQGNQQEANRVQIAMNELQADVDKLNAEIQSRTALQNAAMQTDVSLANSQAWNDALRVNAGIGADIARTNADRMANISMFNAEQANQIRRDVLAQNTALNEQYMAGEQALDLADIQGKYNLLIDRNRAAAQLYDSYLTSIAQAMANDKVSPERIAGYVSTLQQMLNRGLNLLEQISETPVGDSAGGGGGGGEGGVVVPGPGEPGTTPSPGANPEQPGPSRPGTPGAPPASPPTWYPIEEPGGGGEYVGGPGYQEGYY